MKQWGGARKKTAQKQKLVQTNFLPQLFARQHVNPQGSAKIIKSKKSIPVLERIKKTKKTLNSQLSQNKEAVESIKRVLDINKASMGSTERAEYEAILNKRISHVDTLSKRAAKVSAIEKKYAVERIKASSSKNKILVIKNITFNTATKKKAMVDFSKSVNVGELSSVCSKNVSQDWAVINSRRRDVLKYGVGKPKSFSRSANYFLLDLYRISQDLVSGGIPSQQREGLKLFMKVEGFVDKIS